jgi:hypothetical protein
VTIVARSFPASNDATVADVRKAMEYPLFLALRTAEREGRLRVIGSGSNTAGTNLFRMSKEFVHALREAEMVISKGQGNWYTLQGLRKDIFFLLMSKGVTAERSTGVIADPTAIVDGLILAFVPQESSWKGTLRELVLQNASS